MPIRRKANANGSPKAPAKRRRVNESQSQTRAGPSARGRGRGRGRGGGGGRGRGGRSQSQREDRAESPQLDERRHVLIDEDEEEDEAAGEFREEGGRLEEGIWIPPPFKTPDRNEKKERLVIEKITCVNFKSYGGIKEMGPFHKCFSAIVGPNGNGKSNIIDAMLFVFGYRASKIRCKKLSVLIHKSELLPALSSCSVTVHFQKIIDTGDDDDFTVIPNSQIKVTRKAYKDNSSSYSLNDKKVKFQDVAEFLKANGIDIVHNRFLILQGEVESIAQMPPKRTASGDTGLLEFLEDIIGSKRYMKCLIQLEGKVEELNQTRLEQLQAVDLVEREKKSLDEPAKKAKEYLGRMNEKMTLEYHIGQYKCYERQQDLQEVEKKKDVVDGHLKEVKDRLGEINSRNKTRKSELEKAESEHKGLDAEYKKKKKAMDAADTDYTKNTEQLQRTNEQRKKIIKEIAKKEEELETLDQIPVSHESEIEKLEHRNTELEEQVAAEQTVVDKEFAKTQIKINKVLAEQETTEKDYLAKKKVRDLSQREADSHLSDLNLYKQQEKTEKEKFELMKTEFDQIKIDVQEKEKSARKSSEHSLSAKRETLKKKTAELERVSKLQSVKKVELDKIQDSLDEISAVLEGSRGQDAISKCLFAEKEAGRIPGLYGKLKDLATIPEQYNVAMTIGHGYLDYWICDTDDTSSDCIKILKEKELPAQWFMSLNRIQREARGLNTPFTTPPRTKRLFDLLEISKPELRVAFYKGLYNTLVADNLEIARQVPGSHRIVTLKGDLIEPSGGMTGGGRQAIIGKMNSQMAARLTSSYSQKDFAEMKARRESASKEFEELCSQRQTLDQEMRIIMTEIRENELMVQNLKNDLNCLKSQLPLKEVRLKEQEAKFKASRLDPKLLKEKEKAHENALKRLEEAAAPLEEAEKAVAKITEKLKDFNAEKKQIRKKLDKLLEMKKKVGEELSRLTIELKNYKKNRVKVIEKIQNLKTEKEKLQKQMEKMSEAKKRIEAVAIEIKAELEKLETAVQESSEKLNTLKEAANEFRDEENKLNKEKIKYEHELKTVSGTIEKIVATIEAIQTGLAQLELKAIPGEPIDTTIKSLTDEELNELDVKATERRIADLKHKLGKEEPNLDILVHYQTKMREFHLAVNELNEITTQRDKFRDLYIKTMSDRLMEFMSGFATISLKVKELFRMISMGGDAELEIVDCFDPFASGIEFTVRPARKTWKQISYLSGGEKTLSSLALVFALHYFKPSPFYVMDEIDAALDFKNVSIIANYIKERTKNTQFIIISLRSNMFELADSLLGVYKVDNMSYSIHLGVGKLLEQLKKRFQEIGKPFPLVSEYANSPSRKKALARNSSPDLFTADMTEIPEGDGETETETCTSTQTLTQGGTQMDSETQGPTQSQSQAPVEIRTATQTQAQAPPEFQDPLPVVEPDPANRSISTVSVSTRSLGSTSTRISERSEQSGEENFVSPDSSPNTSTSKLRGEE